MQRGTTDWPVHFYTISSGLCLVWESQRKTTCRRLRFLVLVIVHFSVDSDENWLGVEAIQVEYPDTTLESRDPHVIKGEMT